MHVLWFFGDVYHHLVWWFGRFGYLEWNQQVLQDLIKMYSLHILPPGVAKTQRIQAGPQSHLVCGLIDDFRDSLRGFAYAISVFVQH